MSPEEEDLKFRRGCRGVFCAMVVFGLLAWWTSSWFLVPLGILCVGWMVVCQRKAKRDQERLERAFDAAFETFDGPKPELRKSSSYGFPFFSVIFETKEEMNRAIASGHVGRFRASIVKLYGFEGFDIDRGFEATYRGWKEDFLASLETDPTGEAWIAEKAGQAKAADRVFDGGPR